MASTSQETCCWRIRQTLDLLEAAELVNRAPRSVLTESDRYILTLDIISRLRNFLQQQLDGFSAGAGWYFITGQQENLACHVIETESL